MTGLTFTKGDETWKALRKRAVSDLYFFAGVICGYGDPVGMTEGMHKLMCRVAEGKTGVPEIDTCDKRLLLLPRGIGKTTLITQAYALQRICQDPNIAILIANEKLENAQGFLAAIKWQFEQNELFRELFPELIHANTDKAKWNESEINVPRSTGRKEPTIKCQGAGAALASMHVDLIIVDDEISREAAENARRGDGQITQAMDRWNSQLKPLLNPGYQPFPLTLWIGTRWYRGDPYELLEEKFGHGQERQTWQLGIKLPNGDVQSVPVHRRGDLVIFSRQVIENGQPVWPERKGYDLESLAKFRLEDPELFAANMMNSPSDEVTATFKESWLKFYDWVNADQIQYVDPEGKTRSHLLSDLDILVFVDPGGFKKKTKGTDRSRGAIIVTGSVMGTQPMHFLLDAYSDKVTYTVVVKKVLEFAQRYPTRRVFAEVEGQQIMFLDLLKGEAAKLGLDIAFEEMGTGGQNKDARILTLEPYFQRGLIRVGTGPNMHEFREQYKAWPTPRADLLDVLAYGPKHWRRGAQAKPGQSERQRIEAEQYLQRRGLAVSMRR